MCVIDRPEMTGKTSKADAVRTARLILRAPKIDDVDAITRLCGDFGIASMTSRMPHPYAEEDARRFVSQVSRQDGARERTFAIELPGEGLIGCLGFHKGAGAPLEFGYWVGRPYWGQGYATEAATGALLWASEDWGRRTVASGHFEGNAASANVLMKSGFLYTGEVQPRHCQASGRIEPTRMMVWLA